MREFKIADRMVGDAHPAFIISEIGSNFDGDLGRAKYLIDLSVQAGAEAVKFQSFIPEKIISKENFRTTTGFQAKWGKSVWEVYSDASLPRQWHRELADYSAQKGVIFFSAPYDREAVDLLEELGTPVYKIGSGDISWHEHLRYIAQKGKPILLATGASTLAEIDAAVRIFREEGNQQFALLQCVTNYPSAFEDANLRFIPVMQAAFDCVVGYSDHTPGSVVPVASVVLGGRIVEKHFTDDKTRMGPDHPYAMDFNDFKKMVTDIRNVEKALGDGVKRVMPGEAETVILQRRSLIAAVDIPAGTMITDAMIATLRPQKGLLPMFRPAVVGRIARQNIAKGTPITWEIL